MIALLLLLALPGTLPGTLPGSLPGTLPGQVTDSTEIYYGLKDVSRLASWCARAKPGVADLQCRYRLYPLTRDETLIEDLPTSVERANAREIALLAGLWGFRASTSGVAGAMRYGIRSQRLLDRARALDPDDVFVNLVTAHGLLFKPRWVGGDRRAAAALFAELATTLRTMEFPPFYPEEADAWQCHAMALEKDPAASELRARLFSGDEPVLFREIAAGAS